MRYLKAVAEYKLYDEYMLSFLQDSVHDKEHIYRVLNMALEIAEDEENVDMDILVVSCLLHDIGRPEDRADPTKCHAAIGGEKAFHFLCNNGWSEDRAERVYECILQHRFRENNPPSSIESQILFDADKLDVTGAIGIARTLMYKGLLSEPLYTFKEDGTISYGDSDKKPSFLHEYKYKLENLYSKFYTDRGTQLAKERQKNATSFYDNLISELRGIYK